jgi:adenylate kinase
VKLVLLGPPGAGKGTQAKFIQGQFGIPQISTGEILRKAVSDRTVLGNKASVFIQAGKLVPDDLMLGIVTERLSADDCTKGYILDGFPRTVPQAEGFETCLKGLGSQLDRVLYLSVPEDVLIQRLGGRRTCRGCGTLYHLVFNPPQLPGICDDCRGELYQREDDREDIIVARIETYKAQTAPLIQFYRERGLLIEIDGVGRAENIKDHVFESLGSVAA